MLTPQKIQEIKKIQFLFVIAKSRSGTTLFQFLLNSHPNIVAPPESRFIVQLNRFSRFEKWDESIVHRFIDALFDEFFFSNLWKINKEELKQYLLSALPGLDYSLACRLVYYFMRGSKENVLVLSDKNPIYTLFYKPLLSVFPDAKFIHMVRDPRESVLSHLKGFGSKNAMFHAQQWLTVNKIVEARKRQMPERHLTVFYEKMVADLPKTMKDVCNFLNIPYVPEMLQVNKESVTGTYKEQPVFEKLHKNIVKPVDPGNIAKWEKEMSAADVAIVQAVTGQYASTQYGYELKKLPTGTKYPSVSRILKWKFIHWCWVIFTRYRYTHYRFNALYKKVRGRKS